MKRNYIIPEMKVKSFENSVQTAAGTSAVMQATKYFNEQSETKVRDVLVME